MACTREISAYIRTVTFIFGIFAQIKGPRFASAEVKLIGSSEKAMVGSPFELKCSFIGIQSITGFEMSLNDKSSITVLENCLTISEPNRFLYEYNCPSKTELKLIIKVMTRDNDGDVWRCRVFVSDRYESTTYTISVYDNKEHTTAITTSTRATVRKKDNKEHTTAITASTRTTVRKKDGLKKTTFGTTEILKRAETREITTVITTSTKATFAMTENTDHASLKTAPPNETLSKTENTRRHDDKTAIFVGVALGALCFVLLVYSVVVTVLLARKKYHTKPLDQTATQSEYVNSGDQSNVTAEQGRASRNERDDLNECANASMYTALNPVTRDDIAAYEVLQTHTVTAEQSSARLNERDDLNECTKASVYTALNPVTRDDIAAYGVLQTHSA